MAIKVTKADVWAVSIDDRAGGVADKLDPLARAGANFEMVLARRTPEKPGKGMLFVTPVKGAKVIRAAREAGMSVPATIFSVRVEGTDQPGLVRLNADGSVDASFSSPLTYMNYGQYVGGGRNEGWNTRVAYDTAERLVVMGPYLPSADGFPDAIHRMAFVGPADCLFNWAETNYASLFAPAGAA